MISKCFKGIFLGFISVVVLFIITGFAAVVAVYNLDLAAILLSFVCFGAVFSGFYFLIRRNKLKPITMFWIVLGIGVVLRLIYVIFANQPPVSDFKTYHETAEALASGTFTPNRYIAVFPHVIGLPFFLAPFYMLFGADPLVAQILNVVVDGLSMWLIFSLARRLFGEKCGVFAMLLFAVSPSAVYYCEIICTEKLFTLLVLVFLYCMFRVPERPLLFSILSGLAAGMTNMVRPCGLMLLIAAVLFGLFVWKTPVKQKLLRLGSILAVYLVIIAGTAGIITAMNQGEIATKPMGWNLYVGFNTQSFGQWNPDDAAVFAEKYGDPTISPNEFHRQFSALAKERIAANGIAKNLFLLSAKFAVLWATDLSVFSYLQQEPIHLAMLQGFQLESTSTAYYLWLLVFTLVGAVLLMKEKKNDVVLVMLFILGSAAQHLLAEVMGRYGYPSFVLFSIIGAYGLWNWTGLKTLRWKKKQQLAPAEPA